MTSNFAQKNWICLFYKCQYRRDHSITILVKKPIIIFSLNRYSDPVTKFRMSQTYRFQLTSLSTGFETSKIE